MVSFNDLKILENSVPNHEASIEELEKRYAYWEEKTSSKFLDYEDLYFSGVGNDYIYGLWHDVHLCLNSKKSEPKIKNIENSFTGDFSSGIVLGSIFENLRFKKFKVLLTPESVYKKNHLMKMVIFIFSLPLTLSLFDCVLEEDINYEDDKRLSLFFSDEEAILKNEFSRNIYLSMNSYGDTEVSFVQSPEEIENENSGMLDVQVPEIYKAKDYDLIFRNFMKKRLISG